MTRINLLPWREARRTQQQRDFMGMLVGAIIIAALGVIGTHVFIADHIDAQEARNQFLRDEIERLKRIEQEIKENGRNESALIRSPGSDTESTEKPSNRGTGV